MPIGGKIMSAMNGVRKSGSVRRSGVDRRVQRQSSYWGAERRGDLDRRDFGDRRDKVAAPKRALHKKSSLFDYFLRRKGGDSRAPEKREKCPNGYRITISGDENVIIPRTHERTPCDVPVQILDRDTHSFYPAVAHNYCTPGMYLESKHAPRIGSGIVIDMVKHTVHSSGPDDVARYYSKVVWLQKLSGNVVFIRYGLGVKHCHDLDDFLRIFGL